MAPDPKIYGTLELNLPKPQHWADESKPAKPRTPSEYFAQLFPAQVKQYGCPFLELCENSCDGFIRVTPISINVDFFASVFSDPRLGMSVVYFEPEMQWYYRETYGIYRITSLEKLQNLFRGLLMRCAESMSNDVNKLNLVVEFRSDKVAKAVVHRAKSILAAGSDFFSAKSPYQRILGPEIHQRIAQVFVEQLERDPGQILTIKLAYELFSQYLKQKDMPVLKRSEVKVLLAELIREQYGLGLRNDLIDAENQRQQCGWKGLRPLITSSSS
jgi:hypothetical protein